PSATLFPYTTLFRSVLRQRLRGGEDREHRVPGRLVDRGGVDGLAGVAVDVAVGHDVLVLSVRVRSAGRRCTARGCRWARRRAARSEEHPSELQSREN